MDQFESLMALVSVVAGLAITHTLSGIVRIINARDSIAIPWISLIYTIALLLWLIAFWWFTFQYSGDISWTPGLHIFILIYASVIYFLLALLIPEKIEDHQNLQDFFINKRKLFFSAFLLLTLIDIIDSWIKVGLGDYMMYEPVYWFHMASWIVVGIAGMLSTKPKFHLGLAVAYLIEVIIWLSTYITGAFYFWEKS